MRYAIWIIPLSLILWLMWDKLKLLKPPFMPSIRTRKAPQMNDQFRLLLGLALCHGLVLLFWPDFFWSLAKNKTVWLVYGVLLASFLFLQQEVGRGGKSFTPTAVLAFIILVAGITYTNLDWINNQRQIWQEKEAAKKAELVEKELKKLCTPEEDGTYLITAPVNGRSCRVPMLVATKIYPEGPITAWDDQGRPHPDDKGVQGVRVRTHWFEFQSRTKGPVKIRVPRP